MNDFMPVGVAFVAPTASLAGRAKLRQTARILGHALVDGDAYVGGGSTVADLAHITDHARLDGYPYVGGFARVHGDGRVNGWAIIAGCADIAADRHVVRVATPSGAMTLFRVYPGPTGAVWGHALTTRWLISPTDLTWMSARVAHPTFPEDERAETQALIDSLWQHVHAWEQEPLTEDDHAYWAARQPHDWTLT